MTELVAWEGKDFKAARLELFVEPLGEMPRDPRLGPSLKLPAEQKRRLESQCWVILSHSEQFYTDVLKY